MSLHSRKIDALGARLDEVTGRIHRTGASSEQRDRRSSRDMARWKRGALFAAITIGVIWLATIVIGVILDGIGLGGLALAVLATAAAFVLSVWQSREKPIVDYKEDMPNAAVVQRLDNLLVVKRPALPAPAASRIDAISRQLPLLENRLAQTEILDPLAQDARRLMGRHLPELIERYERVPAEYRRERDGEGLTVDERLVAGLDAAKTALDDLGRKLAHEDLSAFETQGRFIESRYQQDQGLRSE
jgi:hypothetical protein